jgi:predicted DNA-binding ribbon-helix-helix protein
MESSVVKRSVIIAGHKTSISLEDAFWRSLKEIALDRRTSLSSLLTSIDAQKSQANLSSAIRLFILSHYQTSYYGHANGSGQLGQAQPQTLLS